MQCLVISLSFHPEQGFDKASAAPGTKAVSKQEEFSPLASFGLSVTPSFGTSNARAWERAVNTRSQHVSEGGDPRTVQTAGAPDSCSPPRHID